MVTIMCLWMQHVECTYCCLQFSSLFHGDLVVGDWMVMVTLLVVRLEHQLYGQLDTGLNGPLLCGLSVLGADHQLSPHWLTVQ
jgi:hypothetical protein